ncbi:MAG: glycosyltransferase, partial [Bacteroidota bacterium]
RIGWYWNGVRAGRGILKHGSYEAIVSIGPPHTAHLVGRSLARLFHLPHVPVFIDPWVDIVYYRGFRRNALALGLDRRYERSVLENAASAVFVTESMREDYERKYPWLGPKSKVLYWGFSEEEFAGIKPARSKGEELVVHAGNLFDYQNPVSLWPAIAREVRRRKTIRLVFIGTVGPVIRRAVADAGLESRTTYLGFLPYREMLAYLAAARCLLVCATEPRHVPGKLFEYLRIGKPILAFGNDNDEVRRILEGARAGMMFRYDEDPAQFFRQSPGMRTRQAVVDNFSRHTLARQLAHHLEDTIRPSQSPRSR